MQKPFHILVGQLVTVLSLFILASYRGAFLCLEFKKRNRGGGKLEKKLTLKQKRFADEYIISGNIYQSALNAGYSENYSKTKAGKLLEKVSVKVYLDERLSKISKAKILDAQARRELLSKLADNEDVSPNDRIKAVDVLNKMDATYVNRQEIEMKSHVQFVDDIESDLDETD